MYVQAHTVRAGTTGVAGSVDVDVVVRLPSGRLVEGEVTLAPDHTGSLVAYGMGADYWVSGALLQELSAVDGAPETLSEMQTQIEAVAAAAAAAVQS